MILDKATNIAFYAALNPRFARVAQYLAPVDLESLPEGRYEIDGEKIFMNIMDGRDLKAPENAPLEAHDRYIDIQIVIRTPETFGWSARRQCLSPRGAIDTAKDILFFDDAPATWFTLPSGAMAIFFPGDAHAPMVGSGKVKKAVIKVLA